MKKLIKIVSIIGLSTGALQGCIYGTISDSSTGDPVEDALAIVLSGNCSGAGCSTTFFGYPYETTDANGMYIFDAYDDDTVKDSTEIKVITPASGEESIKFLMAASGYDSRVVYHKPDYEEITNNGNTWLVSQVAETALCPTGSVDTDGDSLCDSAEAHYGTDPNNTDTDGDGISDTAELFGFNGVDLHRFGADPLHKDVFLEVDYYPGLKPDPAAIQMVIDAFANAPVSNPDGTTGIHLYIDVDDEIAAADVDSDLNPVWTDFDVIKNAYFPARRNQLFHYVLFANQYNGGSSSGISRGIPAQDFVVSLGNWSTPGGTVQQQAGTLMHEFGHNLGLRHGGNENTNYKINYLSIMSYTYQLRGLRVDGVDGNLDYSRLKIASISESSLNESTAMAPASGTTEADLSHYGVRSYYGWLTGNASNNLDFNRNGVIQTSVATDLDGDGNSTDTFNASQDDWVHLVFNGGNIGDDYLGASQGVAAVVVAADAMEPCMTEFQ